MKNFDEFLKPLKETNFSLSDYVDFDKVNRNVEKISIKLNQLNYLIGKEDMESAVKLLWEENPKVFSILDILIALRKNANAKVIDEEGNVSLVTSYFSSPQQVVNFLNKTGLTKVLQNKQITNLVDYVFGVEVGLDTNARKNRSGNLMQNIVASIFENHKIRYRREINSSEFAEISSVLGTDEKRFDFVIETQNKTYLIEVNFFSKGGSKLNEVARSYTDIGPKINEVKGYEFVWITEGVGWKSAKNKLQEAFMHIPSIYNLTTINNFVERIKISD